MSDDLGSTEQLTLQESRDRIQINAQGVRLLSGIALTALLGCVAALILNYLKDRGPGAGGAYAGVVVSLMILFSLRRGAVRLAVALILWGFALIPILFGMRTFGFGAPGMVCIPLSIMAASWALSIRHAITLTAAVIAACLFYYVLIKNQYIVPTEPDISLRLIMLICIIIVALLLGLVGVRALRSEFDQVKELASSLQAKADELKRSEASFSSLFLSNPLPAISGDMQGHMLDVNHAFVSAFGFAREDLIGKSVQEIGLFAHEEERRLVAKFTLKLGVVGYPVTMRLANQEKRHYLISTSAFELSGGWRFVALFLDQTDRLAAEKAQHILTVELEQRVARRTSELSDALQNLRKTQGDLVQAEKLASLGSMVAGIAHELNTPVGNALMVASTLLDQEKQFEAGLVNGLSRNTLNQFLFNIRDSGDILDRNLRRTADLINSFKQIAVDQTSEQRRDFDLQEVAHEVLVYSEPESAKNKAHFA